MSSECNCAGEKAVHFQTEALTVDVLLNARCQTVCSKVRDVLLAGTSYVHVVYSGHVVAGSGDWLLEDDVFTAHKFLAPFKFSDVDDALKACPDATLILNTPATTAKSSEWTEDHLKKNGLGQLIKVKVNHETEASVDGATEFSQWISGQVHYTEVKDLLPSTDVVGNIRFSRPTIYIFPCGHGDSTFFGISGFNLLINGGYGRQAAFWNFVRHVDRIDGLLVTHVDTDNLWGLTSLFEKKTQGLSHPELGVVYLNAPDKTHKPTATPTDAGKSSGLVVSVPEASSQLVDYIHQISRTPLSCVGKITSQHTIEPINLYHKIGHGSLDMYVVNPIGESKDVKELYAQWQKAGGHFSSVKLPTKGGFKDINVPLPRLVSVSVMLVWRPTAADEAITRILLPGATPQSRLFEGLDHLRSMDILQHAQCTAHSLAAAKVVKKPPTPAASAAPPARATTPAPAPATAKSAPTPAKAAPAATPAKAPLSARATPGATPAKTAAPAATPGATPAKAAAPAAKPPAKTPAPKSAPAGAKKEDKSVADKKSTVDKPASAGAKPAAAKDVRKSTAAAKPAASKTTTKATSPAEPATVATPAPVAVINDDKPQDDAGVSSPAAEVEAAPEKESTPEPAAEPAAGGDAVTEVSPAHENDVGNGHEGGVENGTADATADEVPQGLPAMSRDELADIGVYDEHDQQQSVDSAIQPEGLPLPEHDADLQGEETFDPLTAWGQPSGLPAPVTDKKTTATSKSTSAKTPAAKKTDLNQSLPAKVGSAEAADSDQGAAADNNGDIKKAMPPPAAVPRKPRASAAASTRPDRSSSAGRYLQK